MYYAQRRGMSRRSRDALILVILLLIVALIVVAAFYAVSLRRTVSAGSVLMDRGAEELGRARASMSQISRVGGSYSTVQMSLLRQHLYAIGRLNAIATELYGANMGIIDDASVVRALDTISKCESRLLQGQAIDEQLQSLRSILDEIDVYMSGRK